MEWIIGGIVAVILLAVWFARSDKPRSYRRPYRSGGYASGGDTYYFVDSGSSSDDSCGGDSGGGDCGGGD